MDLYTLAVSFLIDDTLKNIILIDLITATHTSMFLLKITDALY